MNFDKTVALRARWALPWIFFLMGVVSMAWVPRIPEIKAALGLSDGEFGVVLVSSSVGAVIGAQLAGRLIQRFGSRNLMRFAQTTLPLGVLLMGLASNVYVLALGLFFMGLGSAAMDIPGNAQAVVIERLIGKKFLASLHGAWSIGTFAALPSPKKNKSTKPVDGSKSTPTEVAPVLLTAIQVAMKLCVDYDFVSRSNIESHQ